MGLLAHNHKMAYIDNTQTKKEAEECIRGNSVSNVVPTRISEDVQMVLDINPNHNRICNIVRGGTSNTSSSTASIYTTPADKDFYLTSAHYVFQKNVTSDNTACTLIASVDGADQVLLSLPSITLTATQMEAGITYSNPIKLTRNTTIRMSASFTVGALIRGANITGYTVEN